MGFWDSIVGTSSGGTNWGAMIGGVLAAGSTIYAANQQKKMQQKQYDQQMDLYNEQIQFQQDQIARAQSTPIAQIAPMLMETLINAYGGKLSKYGINLPIGEMLNAIGRGSPTTVEGGGGGVGSLQALAVPQIGNGAYKKAQLTDFNDAHVEAARRAMGGFGSGTGRRIKNPYVSNDAYADSIWNQALGPGARGPGEGPLTPAKNVGMSDKGYLMSVPNAGGVTITAKDPWYARLGDSLRNAGNWFDSLDESGGPGASGWAQNRGGDVLQNLLLSPLGGGLTSAVANWWLNSDPTALQLENYYNPMRANSSMLSDPSNRAFLDANLGPLFGGQSFTSGYDPSIFGYF